MSTAAKPCNDTLLLVVSGKSCNLIVDPSNPLMARGLFVWPGVKPVGFRHGCLGAKAADMLICRPSCSDSAKLNFD